jgi:hypothetical protein
MICFRHICFLPIINKKTLKIIWQIFYTLLKMHIKFILLLYGVYASRLMLIYLSWRLVMFSGSEFQKPHKRFLQEVLKCLYIDLSVKTVKKSSPALERTIAFT